MLDAGYPKPSPTAQAAEPGAYKLIGTQNQYAKIEQRPLLGLTAKRLSPDVGLHQAVWQTSFLLCWV